MIDPLELRTQLLDLLGDQIGSYVFLGAASPAIAVLPDPNVGYNYPPSGTEVIGIEVVIHCPLNGYVPLMGGGMAPAVWEVRLKQWERDSSLSAIANLIVPALANLLDYVRVGQPILMPANPDKGMVEQVLIRFTEYLAV